MSDPPSARHAPWRPPTCPPAEFAARRARYLRALDGAAAVVFASPVRQRSGDVEYRYRPSSDLYWLTGWEGPDALAVLRPGAEQPFVLFVPARVAGGEAWTGAREGVEGARGRFGADAAFAMAEAPDRLADLLQGYARVHYAFGEEPEQDRVVFGAMRAAGRMGPRNGLAAPVQLVDGRVALGEERICKSAEEVALLRRAAMVSAEAHLGAMRIGRPGRWEYEIEAQLEHTFRRLGGNGPGYPSIVACGGNATTLHYMANRDPLLDGALCLVDAGAEVGWYTADLSRTWPVSGRFTGPQRDLYVIVLAAEDAAIAAVRPGVAMRAVHDAAVRVLVEGMVDLGLLVTDSGVEVLTAACPRTLSDIESVCSGNG